MSNSCVITNEEGWYKKALDTDLARPKFAIMNPEITYTLPDYQTQCGCADIMMHTMERYFVLEDTMEITDKIAQDVMKNVMKYAKILKKDPENYEARAEIMWCGSLSHNGLTGCGTCGGDWATHLIEHELGGDVYKRQTIVKGHYISASRDISTYCRYKRVFCDA